MRTLVLRSEVTQSTVTVVTVILFSFELQHLHKYPGSICSQSLSSLWFILPWIIMVIMFLQSPIQRSQSPNMCQHSVHEHVRNMILIDSRLCSSRLTHRLHFFYRVLIFTHKLFYSDFWNNRWERVVSNGAKHELHGPNYWDVPVPNESTGVGE